MVTQTTEHTAIVRHAKMVFGPIIVVTPGIEKTRDTNFAAKSPAGIQSDPADLQARCQALADIHQRSRYGTPGGYGQSIHR